MPTFRARGNVSHKDCGPMAVFPDSAINGTGFAVGKIVGGPAKPGHDGAGRSALNLQDIRRPPGRWATSSNRI
jgi:hypothetical protein